MMTHDEMKNAISSVIDELERLRELDAVFQHIEEFLPSDIDEEWLTVLSWLLNCVRQAVDMHTDISLAPLQQVWRSLDCSPSPAARTERLQ